MNRVFALLVLTNLFFVSCSEKPKGPLPKLGFTEIIDGDTVYHRIPEFQFMDQDCMIVSNTTLNDNIYLADFFFMSCPSICPKVKKQMLRIYDRFEDEPLLKLVSHTLDPKRDTPKRLKQYATNLKVDTDKWMFLTGEKDDIYDINDDYFIVAYEDEDAPGGIDHSGKIVLVDKDGHIRAFAEGTDPEDVDGLFDDIERLIIEYALDKN